MIDRVVEWKPFKKVVAIKNVSMNEQFFTGHFPLKPVMPGGLIIEAMAQASILLFSVNRDIEAGKNISYYLGNVKVRFLNPVFPGDQLEITVEPVKLLSTSGIVKAQVKVLDKEIAKGELGLSLKDE